MNSKICPLEGREGEISRAMEETERFARQCSLPEKQTLHLRLLTEELLGMTRSVLDVRDGSFWIERKGARFHLYLFARAPVGETAKGHLLRTSTSGQDEFHKGITGKIRLALEWLSGENVGSAVPPVGVRDGLVPSVQALEWSLELYRQSAAREEQAQAWDELERSVLSKLADDIRVGVSAAQVSITIVKDFPEWDPARPDGKE